MTELSMQTAATEATYAAAQATAAQSLQVSKDQYIRLNADFDNFRRRTVCCQAALFKHDIHSLQMPTMQADRAEQMNTAKPHHVQQHVDTRMHVFSTLSVT